MPTVPKPASQSGSEAASESISRRIEKLDDWRGETLSRVRGLIHEACPEIQEEWKWAKPTTPGVPVWAYEGGVCTGEVYKAAVKLTFFRGASVPDPTKLFNASLEGGTRRAIDIHEKDEIDEGAFRQLIQDAAAANAAAQAAKKKK